MKTLVLVRHAKSSWESAAQDDFDRPLNQRGQHDAPIMARRVMEKGVRPDLLVSSPAMRAITTAEIFVVTMGLPQELLRENREIYEAGLNELVRIVRELPEGAETVLLFGHNPGITLLNKFLCGEHIDNVVTCGAICMELEAGSWKEVGTGAGKLLWYEYPKKPA
ncbi:SixA phosphatase family protein [Prosthecochloris sp. CIB 2401]|uniref:SixA phosphatase family protein n=1 Tax=Prosthecochloris sp. CIB 2401 TaxID=1868325 RepID=UPI00080AC075|nr:histidine phosphatase family protein [Prosthecochloris sp. CIB 2401]ANT65918.1 phosphohistidine phosphatase [Prosthecochloris sp. CIB 2401]